MHGHAQAREQSAPDPFLYDTDQLRAVAEDAVVKADLIGAMGMAIEDRVQRGRTEVNVEHLGGEPWFGTWRAASLMQAPHVPDPLVQAVLADTAAFLDGCG